jgi:hypothetical protein
MPHAACFHRGETYLERAGGICAREPTSTTYRLQPKGLSVDLLLVTHADSVDSPRVRSKFAATYVKFLERREIMFRLRRTILALTTASVLGGALVLGGRCACRRLRQFGPVAGWSLVQLRQSVHLWVDQPGRLLGLARV